MNLRRRLLRILRAAFAASALGIVAATAPAAADGPRYEVQRCCELCPLASNPAAYNTPELESFRVLTQGQDGWLFRSQYDLRSSFGPDDDAVRDLRRLHEALQQRGTELVIVVQPPRGLMHADKLSRTARGAYNVDAARVGYTMMLQRLRTAGIVVPDLETLAHERGDRDYFFRADDHWTPDGARRSAKLAAESIIKLPAYAGVTKKAFVTERVGMLRRHGSLQRVASQLCGFGFQDQWADQYATAAQDDTDLLGVQPLPQVALVGTSNSDDDYNFAGFLSEFLSADVLNESVSGGGVDGALFEYLASDEFRSAPPKILVWELETHHNLSSHMLFRTLLPRLGNGCDDRPAALSRTVTLRGDKTEALFNGGGAVRALLGRQYLLDVQYSDPQVRELKGTVWYTNGSSEPLDVSLPGAVDARGHFTLDLRNDGDWGDRTFLSLDLRRPEGAPRGLTAEVKLCARADARTPRTGGRP